MENGWNGVPYRPISELYHDKFGEKVYKISVSVVDDCPNRRGLKGMQTCVFCDVWGSAANAESILLPLREQIEKYHLAQVKKFKANKFLVYFQAYTNTFTKVDALKANFETALSYPFVSGFVVGTRPDCLSKSVLDLWQNYHKRSFVAVELGVQSFFNSHLEFMKRGHTREQSLKAIEQIHKSTDVDLGIHLMFGQPGETIEQIIETAKICNDLPITNVKLHNLHVLKKTELEQIYLRGEFAPIELNDYAEKVMIFLEHLSPKIAIHRLVAYSSRWDELVAPPWTTDRMGSHQRIIDMIRQNQSFQGRLYSPRNDEEKMALELRRKKSQPNAGTSQI